MNGLEVVEPNGTEDSIVDELVKEVIGEVGLEVDDGLDEDSQESELYRSAKGLQMEL